MKRLLFIPFILKWSILTTYAQTVVTYANNGQLSDRYYVLVGGTNSPVLESNTGSCPSGQCGTNQNVIFNCTKFSTSGSVSVAVTKISSSATTTIIRPGNITVTCTLSGGNSTATYTIPSKGQYSFEFSDDASLKNRLMVLAKPLETDIPDSTASTTAMITDSASAHGSMAGKTCMFFRPGKYKFGRLTIPSGITEIYLQGGSYLEGYFLKTSGSAVNIHGRGVMSATSYPYHYGTPYNLIDIETGTGNKVSGITCIEATNYNLFFIANNTTVDGVDIIGQFFNNDAITWGGTGMIIKFCYIRDYDDGLVPFAGNATITHNIFDQLNANCIQLGYTPHALSNFVIRGNECFHMPNNSSAFIRAVYNLPTSVSGAVMNITNFTVDSTKFDTNNTYFINIGRDATIPLPVQGPWVYSNWTVTNTTLLGSYTPMIYIHGFSACFPSFNGSIVFSNTLLNGSGAPMSNPSFFSQSNYNIYPNCGHIIGVPKTNNFKIVSRP